MLPPPLRLPLRTRFALLFWKTSDALLLTVKLPAGAIVAPEVFCTCSVPPLTVVRPE